MSGYSSPERGRASLPRKLGEILNPALDRLATSEQAVAYRAWALAAGDQVAAGAHPRHFSRGVLTVECSSSVWANELNYLGGSILARMGQVAPGHPVQRLRFIIARATRPEEGEAEGPRFREPDAPPEPPTPEDLETARQQAGRVCDARLRDAIEAVLGRLATTTSPEPDEDSRKAPQK